MAYATNPGNLRLQLSDLAIDIPPVPVEEAAPPVSAEKKAETELEIE
jgi:hypothetical protein